MSVRLLKHYLLMLTDVWFVDIIRLAKDAMIEALKQGPNLSAEASNHGARQVKFVR